MTTPLIRAAQALAAYEYADGNNEPHEPFLPMARAVLEAIREPSREMRRAGDIDIPAHCEECPSWQYPLGEDEAAKVWQAMIDKALSEDQDDD